MTENRTSHSTHHLGSPEGSPSQTPNEFGALKIRHQPLAEANGMFSQF